MAGVCQAGAAGPPFHPATAADRLPGILTQAHSNIDVFTIFAEDMSFKPVQCSANLHCDVTHGQSEGRCAGEEMSPQFTLRFIRSSSLRSLA